LAPDRYQCPRSCSRMRPGTWPSADKLLAHIAQQTRCRHHRAIDICLRVDGHPFSGGNRVRLRCCIWNECRNRAISRVADADTTDPSRMRLRARQGIGHVNPVADVDEDAARHPELSPFVYEPAALLEDLHTVVAEIRDEQSAARVHRQAVRCIELASARTLHAPSREKATVP